MNCCLCPRPTVVPRVHRAQAPGPAPDWLCCCLCYAVSGEAIVSSGGCTASGPPLCPLLPWDPACTWRRHLETSKNTRHTFISRLWCGPSLCITWITTWKIYSLVIVLNWFMSISSFNIPIWTFKGLLIDDKGACPQMAKSQGLEMPDSP